MMNLTEKQKRRVNAEMEKLSPQGLELLVLFQKQMKDPTLPLHKLVVSTMMGRFPTGLFWVAKTWMALQGATEEDISCMGRIVNYTGGWGIWSVESNVL